VILLFENILRRLNMGTQQLTKRILIFIAFAFGIPWTAALATSLTIGREDPIRAVTLANLIFILSPALANLITRLITREGWSQLWLRPNFRSGWRFYLAAWLLPLLALILGGSVFYLFNPQSFDPTMGEARKLLAGTPLAAMETSSSLLLLLTVQIMITGLTINALASIGEEFGWRAYLLPKLMARFASAEPANAAGSFSAAEARKASLLVGLIWGVWHWPLLFMSMRAAPETPLLLPLTYLVFTCALSVLLGWVTLRSGSVWPAAIGHGTINATSSLAVFFLIGPANQLLGPGPSGLIGGLGYFALALVLLFNRRAFSGHVEKLPERGATVLEA
jgi:membrane protease YdiL (CAAX protease family)